VRAAVPYPTPDRDAYGRSDVHCSVSHHVRHPIQGGSKYCESRHENDRCAELDQLFEAYTAGCTSTGPRTGSQESGTGRQPR
jgi:hypothetical protein